MSEQKVSQVTQAQVARDFDNVTGDYEAKINSAIAFAGMEQTFYIDIKREHILRLGREHFSDLKDLDVLDLGCGLGAYHPGLEGKFRELHGIRDLAAPRLPRCKTFRAGGPLDGGGTIQLLSFPGL